MKQLLFGVVAVLLSTTVFSQLTVIPKVGSSFTTFSKSDDLLAGLEKPGYKFGVVIGVGLEIGINDVLAVQPELVFIQKGSQKETFEYGYEEKSSQRLNYLEVPVLVKFKFGNFHVNAGPSIGFGLGGRYHYEATIQGDSFEIDGDIKFGDGKENGDVVYFANVIDFGLQVGAGVKVGPVVIDLRYGLGLTNVDDKTEGFSGDWKFKNSAFQLTVGYLIPLGSK